MNDLDQQKLANRIGSALCGRIVASLDRSELHLARKDLEHLFRLLGRADASIIADGLSAVVGKWPADDAYLPELGEKLRIAEARVTRLAAERRAQEALRKLEVHPLRGSRSLAEHISARIEAEAIRGHDWPFEPVFHDTWQKRDSKQLIEDVTLLNRALADDAFFEAVLETGVVAGRVCSLSCYQATVIELLLDRLDSDAGRSAVFLLGAFGAIAFDGTSPRIHALNAQGHLDISTEDKALQYLRFFGGLIHGEAGPFTIVSSREEVMALASPGNKLEVLPEFNGVSPPLLMSAEAARIEDPSADVDKFLWFADAAVVYGNALFTAKFGFLAGGMMEMLGDQPVASDLPILQPRFRVGRRGLFED